MSPNSRFVALGFGTLLLGVLTVIGAPILPVESPAGGLVPAGGGGFSGPLTECATALPLVRTAAWLLGLGAVWSLVCAAFLWVLIRRVSAEIRLDFLSRARLPWLVLGEWSGLVAAGALGVAGLAEGLGRLRHIYEVRLAEGCPWPGQAPDWLARVGDWLALAKGWPIPGTGWLAGLAGGIALFLLAVWFFNLFNAGARALARSDPRAGARSRLRIGVADILWRSRYVLFCLAVFGGLALAMDQSRDLAIGMAQPGDEADHPRGVLALLVGVLGVWLFSHACWLWTRIMARLQRPAHGPPPPTGPCPGPDGRDGFAQWWARCLGALPFLMLAWLFRLASADATGAGLPEIAVRLTWWGWGAALLAGALLLTRGLDRRRSRCPPSPADPGTCPALYYDQVPPAGAAGELWGNRYGLLFGLPRTVLYLPLLALTLLVAVRAADLAFGEQLPLAMGVVGLVLALWTSILGLIAQAALRRAVPWVLLLAVGVGVLGLFGVTDNHRIASLPVGVVPLAREDLWLMLAFQGALALLLMLVLWWVADRSSAPAGRRGPRVLGLPVGMVALLLVALGAAGVSCIADRTFQARGYGVPSPAVARPGLDRAIADWLHGLRAEEGDGAPAAVPVYFVSAEGGGIRSAYWTALVLERLSRDSPAFPRRTFSLSGVSGGSVGAAVWQACQAAGARAGTDPSPCTASLGRVSLLTSLFAAWMFEDVLARTIPSSGCQVPGCGYLSRGLWFERTLQAAVRPGGREPLAQALGHAPGLPHLFLNSTWVEDGGRAIAGTVEVGPADFPATRDQVLALARDLSLATAAHNSARFPYANALGSLGQGPGWGFNAAGHLADGGYFDNSGGHTTVDILGAFQRCLFGPDNPCVLEPGLRDWARVSLMPQAIQIRNGERCDSTIKGAEVLVRRPAGLTLYPGLLGPIVTAFNATGTGANGRVAEAQVGQSIDAWRAQRANAGGGPAAGYPSVRTADLVVKDVLYPLGWSLSPAAREAMEREAFAAEICSCGVTPDLCRSGRAVPGVVP